MNSNKNSSNFVTPQERYESLRGVFESLNSLKIPYANIKGEALSLQAYKKHGQRNYNDVDLLISRNNLHFLEQILTENGFNSSIKNRKDKIMMISSSHQTAPWNKNIKNSPTSIDINFDVFWGEYEGKRINIDDFLSDTDTIVIFGVQLKVLPKIKAFIQLILHHYKDMNSIYHLVGHNCIKYEMFKDIYFLWKNNKEEISLKNLYKLSLDYEIVPYVYYILYFTNFIFKDKDLNEYVKCFQTDEGEFLLNSYGLSEKERKSWTVDFNTRLTCDNLYELIKKDLTIEDIKKLEDSLRLFK